jgi:hypothetical protein
VHHERAAAAQADRLGYSLEAAVAENLQCCRVARIVIKGEYRPGGHRELLTEPRPALSDFFRQVVPRDPAANLRASAPFQ